MMREMRRERWEARRLPILFAMMVLLVLASRIDAARGPFGRAAVYALPLICFAAATLPLRGRPSFPAALTLASGAAAVCVVFLAGLAPGQRALTVGLAACPVAGAVLQGVATARGGRSFAGAWYGIGACFAYAVGSKLVAGKDAMDTVLAAGLLSLFIGGGIGLLLGVMAGRIASR